MTDHDVFSLKMCMFVTLKMGDAIVKVLDFNLGGRRIE